MWLTPALVPSGGRPGEILRPKIALAETSSVAPASYAARTFSSLIPPSTCTCTSGGSAARVSSIRSSDLGQELLARVAGLDAHAEHDVDALRRATASSAPACPGLNASPTPRSCSRAAWTQPRTSRTAS